MIVVVAGQSRKVGKTTAVCRLITATAEAQWVAIKISPHKHTESPLMEETEPGEGSDTARYLAAGAARAFLWTIAEEQIQAFGVAMNLIVESNAALDVLTPDLIFLVVDPEVEEWKPSARRHVDRADAVIDRGEITVEHVELVRARLKLPRT